MSGAQAQAAGVSDAQLEQAFQKLDMENYDNDEDNLVARLLQVCCSSAVWLCFRESWESQHIYRELSPPGECSCWRP